MSDATADVTVPETPPIPRLLLLLAELLFEAGVTTRAFDEYGRVIAQTDANGATSTHAYDAFGRRVATLAADGSA